MNAKTMKTIRSFARAYLTDSTVKAAQQEEELKVIGLGLGATEKQVKRAARVVAGQEGVKVLKWGKRLEHRRVQVDTKEIKNIFTGQVTLVPVYKNLGLSPV